MSKKYTLAEIKAMEGDDDAPVSQSPTKSAVVDMVVGGQTIHAELPAIFKPMIEALPVVVRLFGDQKDMAVSSEDLHELVGGTYRLQAWVQQQIKACNLVEGVDYTTVVIDRNDPANAQLYARRRMSRQGSQGNIEVVYFSTEAAGYIIAGAGKDISRSYYNYLHAVASAATPHLLKKLDEVNQQLAGEKRAYDKLYQRAELLAEKEGFGSVTLAASHKEQIKFFENRIAALEKGVDEGEISCRDRMIEIAAQRLMEKSGNAQAVKGIAEELMTGLGEIRGGNTGYLPAFA